MAAYGFQELPEQTFVEGLGTEINYEVHTIEDGEPGAIVAFVGNAETAARLAYLLDRYGETD